MWIFCIFQRLQRLGRSGRIIQFGFNLAFEMQLPTSLQVTPAGIRWLGQFALENCEGENYLKLERAFEEWNVHGL